MKILEVKDKAEEHEFLEMPRLIYKNDPNWIPHIRQDIEKIFDPKKNKFFRYGEATRFILKDESGKTIGRVAAFINRRLSDTFKQPTGGFGFFECIDDPAAARMLFDTCAAWNKERGMKAMDGPINFGEKDQFWGLMVTNFDSPATYGMNYNPAYYRNFFDEYGFKTYYEQYCYYRNAWQPAQEIFIRKSANLKSQGYNCRCLDPKQTAKFAEDFRTIYNSAWGGHSGFKPMERAQALTIMSKLKPVLDPDIAVFAYYNEEPVGFYISIPELNKLFKYVNGNLNWWGKVKFMYHKLKGDCRTMYSIVFGVAKQHQGKGIEGMMIKFLEEHIYPLDRYDDIILTWIGDFNPKMLKVIENLECEKWRTYLTLRKMLDETIEFERAPIIE